MWGQPPGNHVVYVCLCNALTDRRMQQAMQQAGCQRPCDVYDACGCRPQCGQCVKAVLAMLRDTMTAAPPLLQGAD